MGIVMALGRLPADQARTVLTEVSRRTNVTLLRLAGLLTAWVSCGELNLGICIALEEAIGPSAALPSRQDSKGYCYARPAGESQPPAPQESVSSPS